MPTSIKLKNEKPTEILSNVKRFQMDFSWLLHRYVTKRTRLSWQNAETGEQTRCRRDADEIHNRRCYRVRDSTSTSTSQIAESVWQAVNDTRGLCRKAISRREAKRSLLACPSRSSPISPRELRRNDVRAHITERLFFRTRQQFLAPGCASKDASTARVFKRNLVGDAHLLSLGSSVTQSQGRGLCRRWREKRETRFRRNVKSQYFFSFLLFFLLWLNVYISAIAREKQSTLFSVACTFILEISFEVEIYRNGL